MQTLTGGQAVVKALAAQGVKVVFGIPGVHNLDIYDALIDEPRIEHIVVRHEQAASFMADGYARATGNPGVLLLITGPGLTNALTGIGQAYSDSSPLLVISSQTESTLADKERGTLHELRDQLGVVRPVTLWNRRINRIADIAPSIAEAMDCLRRGRPRPIHLEIPTDVLEGTAPVQVPAPGTETAPAACLRPGPDPALVRRAAALLARATKPLIIAGGGCVSSDAGAALAAVSELLQAPIVLTANGKGCIADDHPLVLGNLSYDDALRTLLSECDGLLAVGTRFSAMNTRGFSWPVPRQLVHFDVDAAELSRNYPAAVAVPSDARLGLESLLTALGDLVTTPRAPRSEEVAAIRATVFPGDLTAGTWETRALAAIRAALGPNDILVNDMTMLSYAAQRYYPVLRPRTFMAPRGYGTLGFSYPAALGAQVGRPDARVLSISGDGGFLFTGVELCTAAQYNLPVVALIVNNGGYGVVKRNQMRRFNRSVDVDLHTPDYMKLAEAFGVAAERIAGVEDLPAALTRAFAARRPYVIEMPEPNQL